MNDDNLTQLLELHAYQDLLRKTEREYQALQEKCSKLDREIAEKLAEGVYLINADTVAIRSQHSVYGEYRPARYIEFHSLRKIANPS